MTSWRPAKGEVVLDPFCGSATACIAAERLGRQWVGIDISEKAYELVIDRMRREVSLGDEDLPALFGTVTRRTDVPKRTDADAPRRSPNIKELLYGIQHGSCAGCKIDLPARLLELDHIIPGPRAARISTPTCNSSAAGATAPTSTCGNGWNRSCRPDLPSVCAILFARLIAVSEVMR